MRTGRTLVAAVLVGVVLAGCSSSSSSSSSGSSSSSPTPTAASLTAAAYSKGACTAMQTWVSSIQQRSKDFSPSGTDLASIQQGWVDFLDGVIQDTDAMLSDLEALGTPDVPDAEAAVTALTDALTKMRDAFQALRDDSANLSTSNAAKFQKDFQAMLQDFQSEVSSLGASMNQISNSELDAAFTAEPACQSIGS